MFLFLFFWICVIVMVAENQELQNVLFHSV